MPKSRHIRRTVFVLISLWRGTAAVAPFAGFDQIECLLPSRFRWQL